MRRALLPALLIGAIALTACASTTGTAEISAGAPSSSSSSTLPTSSSTTQPGGGTTTSTTESSTTSTTLPTSTTVVTSDPITSASTAITQALVADGHSQAYAACVILTAAGQFTGNEAQFIAGALALGHPTEATTVDALKQISLTDQEKADIPGHLQAVYDSCASTDGR